MSNPETKEQIEKRVLEAEKTVLCNMLARHRYLHGMAYAIIVWNGEGDVFIRSRIDDQKQWDEMHPAVQLLFEKMEQTEVPFSLERSKLRNEG